MTAMSALWRSVRRPALVAVLVIGATLYWVRTNGRAVAPESYVFFCLIALAFLGASYGLYRALRALADDADPELAREAQGSLDELDYEKRRLLAALKELEFDLGMGKISPADYAELSQYYERRAIEVMQAIDQASRWSGKPAKGPKGDGRAAAGQDVWRRKAEEALAARLAAKGGGGQAHKPAAEPDRPAAEARTSAAAAEAPAAEVQVSAAGAEAPAAEVQASAAAAEAPAVQTKTPAVKAEAALAAPPASAVPTDPQVEAKAEAPAAATCPACTAAIDAASIFCKRCGARVQPAAVAARGDL